MSLLDRCLLLLVPAMLTACAARVETSPLPAPVALPEYERHMAKLSADDMEGRKPGTVGERKTS